MIHQQDAHTLSAEDWQHREQETLEGIYAYAVQCQAWFALDTPEYAGATRAVQALQAALVPLTGRETHVSDTAVVSR